MWKRKKHLIKLILDLALMRLYYEGAAPALVKSLLKKEVFTSVNSLSM